MNPDAEAESFNPYRAPRDGSGEAEPTPEGRAPRAVVAGVVEARPWLVSLAIGASILAAGAVLFGLLLVVAAFGLLDETTGEAAATGLLAALMLSLAAPAAISAFSAGRAASALRHLDGSRMWPEVLEGLRLQRAAWRAVALGLGASLVLFAMVLVLLVLIATQYPE